MPALPSTLANSWIALQFNKYSEIAALPVLERRFDEVVEFANRRNVPVFCGEYGVFMTNCQKAHRTRWYQIVTEFMDRRRIPRTSWDYRGGFGVFENEWSTRLQFNTDLLLAMGFTPQAIVRRPISVDGMAFHADFFPPGCSAGTWDDQAELDFFNTDTPFSRFAVRWGNAHRYGTFWIIFAEPLDLTKQVRDGHALQFLARTRDKVEFEVRFMNSKPIPWRMRVNITPRLLPPDGEWHAVRLPLDAMVDVGAWVASENKWRTSEGKFSWAAVERLEFVPETVDMKGKYVQFDSIVLAKAAYA
jgi:endoglucanase